jgi:hypothetical protein
MEHDLFGKPLHTFPDHALDFCLSMIFSESRCTPFRIMLLACLPQRKRSIDPTRRMDGMHLAH